MLRRLTSWLLRPNFLLIGAFILFLLAFISIPASVVVGVDKLQLPSGHRLAGKEVGYLSAINWWPTFALIVPLLTACLAGLLSAIRHANQRLVENGMVVDLKTGAPITDATVLNLSWDREAHRAGLTWLLLTLIAVAYSWWECWDNSIGPILRGNIGSAEPDWAVAALVAPDGVSRLANMLFSAYVFTIQGLGVSLALLLLPLGCFYAYLLLKYAYAPDIVLVPNFESEDRRRGFEILEDVGSLMLGSALLSFAALYLTIFRNEYLRRPASDIWDMPHGPFEFFVSMDNPSNAIALMLGVLVIALVVVLPPCLSFCVAAVRARANCLRISSLKDQVQAKPMDWWPFGWIKLQVLSLATAFSAIALFVPTLAPYLISVFAVALVVFIVARIKKLLPA